MPVAPHGALATCVFDWTICVENVGHLWHLMEPSVNKVYGRTCGSLIPVLDWTVTFAVLAGVEFHVSLVVRALLYFSYSTFSLISLCRFEQPLAFRCFVFFWDVVSSSGEVGTDTSVFPQYFWLAYLLLLSSLSGKCLPIELTFVFVYFRDTQVKNFFCTVNQSVYKFNKVTDHVAWIGVGWLITVE